MQKELVLAVYEVGQCFFQGWGVPRDKAMAVVSPSENKSSGDSH